MARPRLVHEGLPIGCSSSTVPQKQNDEHDMMMLDTTREFARNATKPVKSSLLNALGGNTLVAKSGQKAHNSRFVIGADRQMKSVADQIVRENHTSDPPRGYERINQVHLPHPSASQHPSQFFVGENHQMMMTTEMPSPQHVTYSSAHPLPAYSTHQYPIEFDSSRQQESHLSYQHAHNNFHTNQAGVPSTFHPHNNLLNTTKPGSHIQNNAQQITRTHIQIGKDERPTESMEGVEDHSIKPPLVVLDGANVAHAYGKTLHSRLASNEVQPDARGILVACEYFARAHLRVLVVLPAHWFQRKNSSFRGSTSDEAFLSKVIEELDYQGILVPSPPSDDDDAYALTIAQRENTRAVRSHRHGPGYVLSNDMFRDAQNRDATGELKTWLTKGLSSSHARSSSLATAATGSQDMGPGRISYTFCDMGRIDDRGERELDFIPNPRHPLIAWIESQRLTSL